MPELRQLYQTLILESAQNPSHSDTLTGEKVKQVTVHNSTCGDQLNLSGIVTRDKLVAISQQSSGCIISRASASIMTDLVAGKSVSQIQALMTAFIRLMQGQKVADQSLLQQAIIFKGVGQFPLRVKCALLPWQALDELIEGGK